MVELRIRELVNYELGMVELRIRELVNYELGMVELRIRNGELGYKDGC